ncbi:coniferyl aldehyde dehydrogenase [Variovorax sp. J31P179]|uniref:coniferyl aldehyde dehydrogenase n=1 Tax=Variovorax sp. J31P179 TaxID=3053508 RepID=UPI002575EEFA|nr:coniferyl aldehyde dehydrogenase [Variovorax sp. J31P179]MDM0079009.1 coniferyl aldehyde dehydrogenase [Variovorax sp. J31P179]
MNAIVREQMLDPSLLRMREAFDRQRAAFGADMNPSHAVRIDRLDRLLAMTDKIAPEIERAVSADFGHRSVHVTRLADVMMVQSAIRHARRHLKSWMKVRRAPTGLAFRPGFSRIVPQPLGVVGVVSPWNYPYQLAMGPAIAAIGAGNRVMIKPSELTPRLAELMRAAVAECFSPEELTVVTGGTEVGTAFVGLPFDHLLFTGSTAVGRQVAMAAAANLTPVTLELGGKSPAIIGAGADLEQVAARLVVGKLFNAGQTCIAPDYAAVPRNAVGPFVEAMRRAVARQYPRLAGNPDYTGIVSERHFTRLQGLLADAQKRGARVVPLHAEGMAGGAAGRVLAPALVLDTTEDMKIMQEEIFGPLLPVLAYDTLDEVIAYVNAHERPLALYWFGAGGAEQDRLLSGTISGGVTLNDCMWHFGQEELPFGGVGASGMGAYHGAYGFRTFSKEKPVFHQSRLSGTALLRPPYGRTFERMGRLLRLIT